MVENRDQGNFREDSNVIFIGKKPLVNYVKSVLVQFGKKGSDEVIIRSRGKFISKAVDVAEIVKRSMKDENVNVVEIKIASEHFEVNEKTTNISTMDIKLRKGIQQT